MKKVLLVVLLASLVAVIVACSVASDVALLKTAKTLTDSWLAVYAPLTDTAKVNALFDAAITAAGNYQPGKNCANVVATVDAVGAALSAIKSGDPKAQLLIATVIASVDLVSSHFANCTPGTLTARHQDTVPNAPATAKELKARWKALGGPG